MNLEPQPGPSLQGDALTRMQRSTIQQYVEHSADEMVRDLFLQDSNVAACTESLRRTLTQGDRKPLAIASRCAAIDQCQPFVSCLDEAGDFDTLRKGFASSRSAPKPAQIEPEGPWKVATYLLGMAVMVELFHCCLPQTRRRSGSARGAAEQPPKVPAGSSACLAKLGERPRRCAAAFLDFAKEYVTKRLPSRNKEEQAALRPLLITETGPVAVKQLQENTDAAVSQMTSATSPLSGLCSSPAKARADQLKQLGPILGLAACATQTECRAYVSCLAREIQK